MTAKRVREFPNSAANRCVVCGSTKHTAIWSDGWYKCQPDATRNRVLEDAIRTVEAAGLRVYGPMTPGRFVE